MIAIVDTGGANLSSVRFAFERLGEQAELTSDARRIASAERVLLPGVGAAQAAMKRLEAHGLTDVVKKLTQPVLGICLGMQLFFEASEEGDVRCLGLVEGTVRAMTARPDEGVTIPHMGWNTLEVTKTAGPLFEECSGQFAYFTHSYCAPEGPWVRATAQHGQTVVAAVQRDNFFGVQFHPERSGEAGAALLRRFCRL